MGLDAVEIVMSIEDQFGIRIKPAEHRSIRTVGDLISLIQSRIEGAQTACCPHLTAFHSLRRLVQDTTGDSQMPFRPSDRIEDVLSTEDRRQLWKRMPENLEVSPPSLSLSRTASRGLLIGTRIAFAAICYLFAFDPLVWCYAIIIGAIAGITVISLSPGFGSQPPEGWITFGDIARRIAETHVATKNLHRRSEESILEVLQQIVSETLCVPPHSVVPSALLIEDLGMS